MSFLVTIYERRVGVGQYSWTTLGLGPATLEDKGSSLALLKERFLQRLKSWVRKAKARELTRLEKLPGLVLERHRVTLEVKRMTAILSVPLVVEPRHAGGPAPLLIGYHPLEQKDFFVIRPDQPRALQYRIFLEHLMREADDVETLEELQVRKDRLRTLVFDAEVPSLLERVGPAKGAWWSDLQPDKKPDDDGEAPASELDTIAGDLSERAAEKGLALGLGREPLGARLRTLAARGPVVLLGPPGVGKTTLVYRWVAERLDEDGYPLHKSLDRVRRVWALSGRRILAGMKHHGDWEARLARLIAELVRRRGFLVVPDLPAWARLGRTRDSERSLADVMRGPLERREVLVVGEATPEAWSRLEEDAPAFAAQFQVLRVPEPHGDDLVRMLLQAGRKLEDGGAVFEAQVFRAVRGWSQLLYPGRAEPGRSLALLAEAKQIDDYVSEYELVDALTERAGVPNEIVTHNAQVAGFVPQAMQALAGHIVGQAEATSAMVDLLQRVRIGLSDDARPWGVFLFTGPTGTGKTELAKGLAQYLYGAEQRLLRIDMNQLTGPDAPARLIGDAFQPDGLLTAPILETPFQVVLLDELEKAHPSALYLLLQLLDEGRLTDAAGRSADFRRAVILITSNLGAAVRPAVGFNPRGEPGRAAGGSAAGAGGAIDGPGVEARSSQTTRAVAAALPPELFNRLDGVLTFQPLGPEVALAIADRQVARLAERPGLRDRQGSLSCTPEALALIARQGFDAQYGARTVKRWIEAHITDRIAAGLVTVTGDRFKRVRVDAAPAGEGDAGIAVTIEVLEPAAPTLVLPWGHLLELAPVDCDRPLDRMIERLAGLAPRAPKDAADERLVVAPADAAEADRVYWREQLRGALAESLKEMRRMRNMHRSRVHEIVEALSQASFLARVAPRVDEELHRVTLRLSRPMRGRSRRLLPALFEAYLASPWELEEFAKVDASGRVSAERPDQGSLPPAGLRSLVADAERVVMRVAGLGVREALAAEVGSLVLESMTDGLEVVTVEVLGREADAVAAKTLLGGEVGLGEQIRTLRHEAGKEARPYFVEDHRLGHRESGHIAELGELVRWCLALSRSAEAREPAQPAQPAQQGGA